MIAYKPGKDNVADDVLSRLPPVAADMYPIMTEATRMAIIDVRSLFIGWRICVAI